MKNNKLFVIFSSLCILHNVPFLGYYFSGFLFPIITLFAYVFAFQAIGNQGSLVVKRTLAVTLLPIFYTVLYCYVINRYSAPIGLYMYLQVAIYPIIGLYLINTRDIKTAKSLLIVFIVSYLITCITTSYGCYLNPTAARSLTGQQDDTALYSMLKLQNIGDFHFVYFLVFSLPLIICAYRFDAIKKIPAIILIGTLLFTIYMSAYTTALLLSIIGSFLLVTPKILSTKRLIVIFSLLAIVAVFSTQFLSGVIASMASAVGSEDVAQRLGDMSNYVGTGQMADEGNDMSIRLSLWQGSLGEFFASPIWGTWGGKNIGGHSYFFDSLGHFGLIGLMLYVYMFTKIYKTFFKPFEEKPWYGYLLTVFILVITQSILNPTPSLLTTTLVVPIFTVLFSKYYDSKVSI